LRKWASNSPELLDDIDPNNHGLAQSRELCEDDSLKILGLTWNPNRDIFQFRVDKSVGPGETKRQILSNIAKLFDPLGWATPVVIRAKILMKQLWASKYDWDRSHQDSRIMATLSFTASRNRESYRSTMDAMGSPFAQKGTPRIFRRFD